MCQCPCRPIPNEKVSVPLIGDFVFNLKKAQAMGKEVQKGFRPLNRGFCF